MFRSHFTCEVRKPTCFRSWHDHWNWKETQMLGTTRLPDYNIFTCAVREDELLLKWSIRHPRRLPGYPFYRRLLLTRQMKTALETIFQSSRPKPARLPAILLKHFNDTYFAFHRVQTIWFGYPVASKCFPEHPRNQSQFLKFDDWQRRAISCAFSICVCDIFFATISRLDWAVLSPDDAEIFNHIWART